MTETTFPFEGQTASPVADVPEESGAGSRRAKLLALVGVAVAVLGIAAYFLLFAGGSDKETPAAAPKPVHAVSPTEAPAAAAPEAKQRISAKSFGHNPFKALVVPADATAGAAASGTTSVTAPEGGTTTTPTGTTVDPATGGTTTGGTTTVGTTTGSTTVTPTVTADHTFRVVGVSSDGSRITVRVDGKSYSGLKAGEVFATYFKVVVIGGKVNGFQFGDEKFSVFGTKKLSIAA
jgi:hypothetical protein